MELQEIEYIVSGFVVNEILITLTFNKFDVFIIWVLNLVTFVIPVIFWYEDNIVSIWIINEVGLILTSVIS